MSLKREDFAARVINEQKERYKIITKFGEMDAAVSGKFRHNASVKADFPAVGDWVVVAVKDNFAVIHYLLPRKSSFSRNVASSNKRTSGGVTEEQIVASNIDTVFIVTGLDENYNVRRIERYLTLAWNSGATPVIVLNKSDLCDDVEEKVSEVEEIAFGVSVHPVSAKENSIEELKKYIKKGKSIALLGSSGAGKSTIVNSIIGFEKQKVSHISDTVHKGRHTTTSRELIVLNSGGILIDTPGMREIQLWTDEESLSSSFKDVEELLLQCKFSDCSHTTEPGCAVQRAIAEGTLENKRFQNYINMKNEIWRLELRKSQSYRQKEQEFGKKISKIIKQKKKNDEIRH